MSALRDPIERYSKEIATPEFSQARKTVKEFLRQLESGTIRAASREGEDWVTHSWVKEGILLAFRLGTIVPYKEAGPLGFSDKDNLPPQDPARMSPGIRLVPGGSAIRAGAHVAPDVTLMPPCYVNVGAFIGEGSMIDSHALVGSCAQVGARVHVSAAAQIGGVLEPVGQLPVIVEDEAMIGGNTGLYEGVLVRKRAVIGAGVVLTRSTPLFDLVHGTVIRADERGVLEVPEGAAVVMGSRPAKGEYARELGLQIATPLIVKYRDASTDARTALEEGLRP